MCTAIFDNVGRPLFGRTLDVECSYGEEPVRVERGREFAFVAEAPVRASFAIKGMAHVHEGVPLFYDAVNECGLAMAALNFPRSAVYLPRREGMHNLASFELITWILSQCATCQEAVERLKRTSILPDSVALELRATPLHWMLADRSGAVVVEPLADGLAVQGNPYGVLTNEPPFAHQLASLAQYRHLSPHVSQNQLCPDVDLPEHSRGLGAVGLPGDWSSTSRFVRAVFVKSHTILEPVERENQAARAINRFFHIMESVAVPLGAVRTQAGEPVSTVYTSCVDLATSDYHFRTYRGGVGDAWDAGTRGRGFSWETF